MSKTQIWHNPRCSKSRATLVVLEQNGITPEIILYLETPPSVEALTQAIRQLDINARDLLRKGEDAYKELNLKNQDLSDQQLIEAMASHPKLIERPIVFHNDSARIGRPPEQVMELF